MLMGRYCVGDFPLADADASSQGKAPRCRAGAQAQADAGMQLVLGRQVEARGLGGMVAQVASVETVGGQVTNLKVSLDTYVGVFTTIGWISVGIGVLLLVVAVPLRKLMHGVT